MVLTFEAAALLALLLLILAALFSGCEAALSASSRARLHEFERRGSRRAAAALKLTGKRESAAGALLFCKSAASLGATALVTAYFTGEDGVAGLFPALVGMILVVLVFVELIPKTLTILSPERIAMLASPVLKPVVFTLGRFVLAIERLIMRLARLFGLNVPEGQEVLTAHQELRGAIDLHLQEGAVVKKDRDMLGGILDLSELEVQDVMVHRTKMLSFDVKRPPGKMLEDILKSGHTRVPIWKDRPDNIVGILNAKNLFAEIHKHDGDESKVSIEDIISAPWFVPDTRALSDQLNAFLRRRTHFAIVVDEYGEMMGIVTLEDIIEEIVGDISDEHDTVVAGIRQQTDGSFIVDGTVPVRDLNRMLEWPLPENEATTVAGYVIHEARIIPVTGQVFTFHGFRFEVLRKRRHQITALRVTPLSRVS
jgi:Mg2+/Co2+ transporter CorB